MDSNDGADGGIATLVGMVGMGMGMLVVVMLVIIRRVVGMMGRVVIMMVNMVMMVGDGRDDVVEEVVGPRTFSFSNKRWEYGLSLF